MRKRGTILLLCLGLALSADAQKDSDASRYPAPCRYQGEFGSPTQSETAVSGVLIDDGQTPNYASYVMAGRVGNTTSAGMLTRLTHFGAVSASYFYTDPASAGSPCWLTDIQLGHSNRLVSAGSSAFSANNYGGYDFWALLTDTWGNTITSAVYGTGVGEEFLTCARPTSDGGYIFAGQVRNTMIPYPEVTQYIAVVKTDASLAPQWHRRYEIPRKAFVEDIIQLTDGSYVLVGANIVTQFDSSRDLLVMRLGSGGNVLWARRMGNPAFGYDSGYTVREIPGQQLLVVGSGSALGAGYGAEDLYMIRMTWTGNVLWQRLTGWPWRDEGIQMAVASNGAARIGGRTQGPNGNPGADIHFWQLETWPDGSVYWSRTYKTAIEDCYNYDIDLNQNASAWLVGWRGTGPTLPYFNAFVVRTDPFGCMDTSNPQCGPFTTPSSALISNPVVAVSVTTAAVSGVKRPLILATKYDMPGSLDCMNCGPCALEKATMRVGQSAVSQIYDEFRTAKLVNETGLFLSQDYYAESDLVGAILDNNDDLAVRLGELTVAFSESVLTALNGNEPAVVSTALLDEGIELAGQVAAQLPDDDRAVVEGWLHALQADPVAFAESLGISIKLGK